MVKSYHERVQEIRLGALRRLKRDIISIRNKKNLMFKDIAPLFQMSKYELSRFINKASMGTSPERLILIEDWIANNRRG